MTLPFSVGSYSSLWPFTDKSLALPILSVLVRIILQLSKSLLIDICVPLIVFAVVVLDFIRLHCAWFFYGFHMVFHGFLSRHQSLSPAAILRLSLLLIFKKSRKQSSHLLIFEHRVAHPETTLRKKQYRKSRSIIPSPFYTAFIPDGGGGGGGGGLFTLNLYKNLEFTTLVSESACSYSTNHCLHVSRANCGVGVYIVTNHPFARPLALKRGWMYTPIFLVLADNTLTWPLFHIYLLI